MKFKDWKEIAFQLCLLITIVTMLLSTLLNYRIAAIGSAVTLAALGTLLGVMGIIQDTYDY